MLGLDVLVFSVDGKIPLANLVQQGTPQREHVAEEWTFGGE